jgi:hypothetical protein
MYPMLWLVWFADLVALLTGLALLKDAFVDRASVRHMWATLLAAAVQIRSRQGPDLVELQRALRFGIRAALLVLIVAGAGVCLVFPVYTTWHGMLLRTALALHMAAQVPCPWLRWITVGDRRAQGNDSPGPQRRVH